MLTLVENESTVAQPDYTVENLAELHAELDWLTLVIEQVICSYLKQEGHEKHWLDIAVPDLTGRSGIYASLVRDWQLNTYERLALPLALAPHLRPDVLDVFFGLNAMYDCGFTEFGGVVDKTFSGFLPTGQTLSFLICGNDPHWRPHVMAILDPGRR